MTSLSMESVPLGGAPRPGVSPNATENAARAALDTRTGRALSDREWAQARAKLLAFAMVLRDWDRQAQTPTSGLGNVG